MTKIATDIYTFSDLRGMGFNYVDKTAGILSLIDASIGKQVFCARPRRFGKSLLVTTLQSIFEGRTSRLGVAQSRPVDRRVVPRGDRFRELAQSGGCLNETQEVT